MPSKSYKIRLAITADIPALRQLIEQSVRTLQANDYTPAQIEGALNHALGLDTQLIADQTYFVAETPTHELAACGVGPTAAPSSAPTMASAFVKGTTSVVP
jgi:hypothetical protein